MPHASSRERLSYLLDLAAQGAEGRAALPDELARLLVDWPADYVQAMRGPFEALFEKTAREATPEMRAALAERLADHDELPVALLNEFFLDASPAARAHILKPNAALDEVNGAFLDVFAHALSLQPALADAILADAEAMAVACRGAGIDRAAYSAIALLTASALADFENIPLNAAARLVAFWQARN